MFIVPELKTYVERIFMAMLSVMFLVIAPWIPIDKHNRAPMTTPILIVYYSFSLFP